jgi:hypothetical protein
MSYDNTNTGILARNERKEQDNHPDFTGTINVGGVDYWLSAWTKDGKPGSKMEGRKFFSLSVKPKDAPAPAKAAHARKPVRDDDDIPF